MMLPDASKHNTDTVYLRLLVDATGMTQTELADRMGVNERSFRMMLDRNRPQTMPYSIQYCLEQLAKDKV
jgi:DNA-binding transcriptional regulator LsrR (DeoR family)